MKQISTLRKKVIAILIISFCAFEIVDAATLNLKFFIQGYYIGNERMTPVWHNCNGNPDTTLCDYVTIYLLDQVSPFTVIESVQGTLHTDGTCSVTVTNAVIGNSYYIDICHRGTIQTMSSSPVIFSSVTSFDFSNAISKAFGNNQVDQLNDGVWEFYSGDFNGDCVINASDFDILDYDIQNFVSGCVCTDLNGDGNVDNLDFPIFDQNVQSMISCQSPGSLPVCNCSNDLCGGFSVEAGPDQVICQGDITTLSANANGGTPTYFYSWTPSGGLTSSISVVPTATTVYTVAVTDNNGCTDTDQVTVIVNSVPAPSISINSTQCGYGVPTAEVVGSGGLFNWYLSQTGGAPISGETGIKLTSYFINSTTVFYVSEFNGTCESERVLVTATVVQPDQIIATASSSCSPITLSVTQNGSNNSYAFEWTATPSTGSGISGSVPGSVVTVSPSNSGTYEYQVTGTDVNLGCVAISTVIVNVNVNTNDGDACTIDYCDTATGLVSHTPVNFEIDSVFCNGLDNLGHQLYHYSIQIINSSSGIGNIASFTSPDGTILSASSSTIAPGANYISGNIYAGQSILTKFNFFSFNIDIVYPPSSDTCHQKIYITLPNCSGNVCDSNLLQNGTLASGIVAGGLSGPGHMDNWNSANGFPVVANGVGCDEPGYIKMQGNKTTGDAIMQTLDPLHKIEKGKWYKVSMCLKLDSVLSSAPNLKIRAVAFNGSLPTGNHPPPTSTVSIIGWTGLINSKEWTTVELDNWYAYKSFDNIAFNIYNNDVSNSVGYIDGMCLRIVTDTCDCDGFERDSLGNIIIPEELLALMDTTETEPTTDTEEVFMGSLQDIYGDSYEGIDTFYYNTPTFCCMTISGESHDEEDLFNPEDSLAALGVTISVDSVRHILSDVADSIANNLLTNFPNFEDNFSVLANFPKMKFDSLCFCGVDNSTAPVDPGSPFEGMDIVFVNGFLLDDVVIKIVDATSYQSLTKWPNDPREFYNNYHGNGYYGNWKRDADSQWQHNIKQYLTNTQNRYMTVAWASTQRIPYSAHAMLSQIWEAMSNGQGVQFNPGDSRGTSDFGRKGLVIISHSAGALLTNAAMALADMSKTNPLVQSLIGRYAWQISDKVKMHVSLHGAISGTHFATLGLAVGNPAVTLLAAQYFGRSFSNALLASFTVYQSVLVDLCPSVSQLLWMYPISILNLNHVPTLTVSGGSPGSLSVENNLLLKHIFHSGFDDGTLTLESQSGNLLPAGFPDFPSTGIVAALYSQHPAPGVYIPSSKVKAFDLGISLYRAGSNYIAQFKESNSLYGEASAGCTPFLSPTGMVQPVDGFNYSRNPLFRYRNHYSFLQSTSDHYGGPLGHRPFYLFQSNPPPWNIAYTTGEYDPSFNEANKEEEGVITNKDVYNNNLISPSFKSLMERVTKGPHKTITFRIPKWICKKCKPHSRTFWLWKRNYDRLHDWQTLMECDYVYKYVLKP